MKRKGKVWLMSCLLFLLGTAAALILFCYNDPMDDKSYDLSILIGDGEEEWLGDKGWSVYTNEQGVRKELEPDGSGGYSGLDTLGQTLYYSREMNEELDSPTLRIDVVNRTVSVFLDDNLIYTDCPELDNRIGWLQLPMLEYDQMEPVVISLPADYLGHTLTIAQSSPVSSEKQDGSPSTVYPCDVTLYCGYAYESELIGETSGTMIRASLVFALGIVLLIGFIWNYREGKRQLGLVLMALALFLHMAGILASTSYFVEYFGLPPVDLRDLPFHLSIGVLLLFLAIRTKERFRAALLVFAILQWGSTGISVLGQIKPEWFGEYSTTALFLPQITGFLFLAAAVAGILLKERKDSLFFKRVSRLFLLLTAAYAVCILIGALWGFTYAKDFLEVAAGEIRIGLPNLLLERLWWLYICSVVPVLVQEFLEGEAALKAELSVLELKQEMALESYENLRRQTEEVMMIRHDTAKHYSALRVMAEETPDRIAGYLDELLGQNRKVRPMIRCGNQMMDIILNGKLNEAAEKGIRTEITSAAASPEIRLSDVELCSLFVNILDNAIRAASGKKDGYIRLDLHCKGGYCVFICENSFAEEPKETEKKSVSEHGYGLKIISQIMHKYGDMMTIEREEDRFRISVAIPLVL